MVAYLGLSGSIIIAPNHGWTSTLYMSVLFFAAPVILFFVRKFNKNIKPEKIDLLDEISEKASKILTVLSIIGLLIAILWQRYAIIYIILYGFFLYLFLPHFNPVKEKEEEHE